MDSNDDIVISGMSGRYPNCNNVEEFQEALFGGTDLISEDNRRYPVGIFNTPRRFGKVPAIEKFDADFFGISPKQAEFMDPRHRILHETTFECIIDAGYNPGELRGSKTGVYVALGTFTNMEQMRENKSGGYVNPGVILAMAANRLSYFFDFKGPSSSLDAACSSGVYVFAQALNDLKAGHTDNAIVCGAHLVSHPHETSEYNLFKMLSPEGKCKAFSSERNGFVRSEAVVSLLLQRRSKSRRIYATVLGSKINTDGFKEEGITFPSSDMQFRLTDELFKEIKVCPEEVAYVEAHGTGTPVGDIEECKSLTNLFGKNRKDALPVGSVKSNMGHAEMASALCSISKVLIAMESGLIPANLHAEPIDNNLPGIQDGKLKVVTNNLQWNGGIASLNSFGFGGTNGHIVLKSNPKDKIKSNERRKHRLVQVSGRTEEAVYHFLNVIQNNKDDEEFLALVDEIHKTDIKGHNYRGYIILGDEPKMEVGRYTPGRPICFIYAGMGSQWLNMGRDLMKIEVFKKTFRCCASALKPYNIDLENIVMNTTPETFENVINIFCAITSVEVALTDLLYSLGIVPDYFAGHSLGEVGCAYADGEITPEEAVLLSYARGYANLNVPLPSGIMAAVALSVKECQKSLPQDIYIACQNGKNIVTLSGPTESTKNYVEGLKSQGIFAKLVDSAGFAYHSKYTSDAAPLLMECLNNILKDPKPRSSKWISSSVPPDKKYEVWAKYNCARYHHNNFCNTVLFDQVYEHIDDHAIVVEVSPHGLLQAILKRELGPNTTNISLVNKTCIDNEQFLLAAIGKIYIAGGQPNLRNLYNEVLFPVSRGTKMLSSVIKWDHSLTWYVPNWKNKDSFGKLITVNVSDEDYSYLEGHNINGSVIVPGTLYLELVWRVLADMHMTELERLPVVIENIKFKRTVFLFPNENVEFLVNIMKKSGYFEVFQNEAVVATGYIWTRTDVTSEFSYQESSVEPRHGAAMTKEEVYREFSLRGYNYCGLFQGLKECDIHGNYGKVEWKGKFDSFIETMLQLGHIQSNTRDLNVGISIQQVVIDPLQHLKLVDELKDITVYNNKDLNIYKSGGIEVTGLKVSKASRIQKLTAEPLLETYDFIYYESHANNQFDWSISLRIALQIVLQNVTRFQDNLQICQLSFGNNDNYLNMKIKEILNHQSIARAEYVSSDLRYGTQCKYHLIVDTENLINEFSIHTVVENLSEDGFMLYIGELSNIGKNNLQIMFQAVYDKNSIYLLRPNYDLPEEYSVVNIRNNDFQWLEKIKILVKKKDKRVVYLFSQGEEISGIIGLLKCLCAETNGITFRAILIEDKSADIFSLDNDFYLEQLTKNLNINILRHGDWGTLVYLPLSTIENHQVENASATILTPGDLSTLRWIERPSLYLKSDEEAVIVYIVYSSLSFNDVRVSLGELKPPKTKTPTDIEISMGQEYAGITSCGVRVMGLVNNETLSLQVKSDPIFTWSVPESWSLKEAATVPHSYSFAYYSMLVRGHLQSEETVLIHSGSGGIDLAAISIALSINCTVYATAANNYQKDFLKKIFPQLNSNNIGNLLDKSLERSIMRNTKGRGVDLVFNTSPVDLLKASLRCLTKAGRFLQIENIDSLNEMHIESAIYLKKCVVIGNLMEEFHESNFRVRQIVKRLVDRGILQGVVRPLPKMIFNDSEIKEAFLYLSSSCNSSKVLIRIRPDAQLAIPPIRKLNAIPKLYFDPTKCYILLEGLTDFGLELADWMIRKGATKIVLNSRRRILTGFQALCLRRWSQSEDVTVSVNNDDASIIEGAEKLIYFAKKLGEVEGIFNMAFDCCNKVVEQQTEDMYKHIFQSKVLPYQNLDAISRKTCPKLSYFVVFTSLASGRGSSEVSNYGMACSSLESLCEKRKRDHLPGLAVQWGPIENIQTFKINDEIHHRILSQNITSCLTSLEKIMMQSYSIASSIVLKEDDDQIEKSTSESQSIARAVANTLGIKKLDLTDKAITLSQFGLDSILVARLKQTLSVNYKLSLSTEDIRNTTFKDLLDMDALSSNKTIN